MLLRTQKYRPAHRAQPIAGIDGDQAEQQVSRLSVAKLLPKHRPAKKDEQHSPGGQREKNANRGPQAEFFLHEKSISARSWPLATRPLRLERLVWPEPCGG